MSSANKAVVNNGCWYVIRHTHIYTIVSDKTVGPTAVHKHRTMPPPSLNFESRPKSAIMPSKHRHATKLSDYTVLETVGTGSFGTCTKVRRNMDGKVRPPSNGLQTE